MLGKTYDDEVCSMARALELVGERWSLLIVRDALFAGSTRFKDFQRGLGVATNVLTARLDAFVDAGIMAKVDQDYGLTAKGRALAPAIVALSQWGDEWAAPGEPPILYRHAECGGAVAHQVVCEACGPVTDLRAHPGPGMPAGFVEAKRSRRGLTSTA